MLYLGYHSKHLFPVLSSHFICYATLGNFRLSDKMFISSKRFWMPYLQFVWHLNRSQTGTRLTPRQLMHNNTSEELEWDKLWTGYSHPLSIDCAHSHRWSGCVSHLLLWFGDRINERYISDITDYGSDVVIVAIIEVKSSRVVSLKARGESQKALKLRVSEVESLSLSCFSTVNWNWTQVLFLRNRLSIVSNIGSNEWLQKWLRISDKNIESNANKHLNVLFWVTVGQNELILIKFNYDVKVLTIEVKTRSDKNYLLIDKM